MTILTHKRQRFFENGALATLCKEQFLRAAKRRAFTIRAGTLMPEHTHLLVQGLANDSNLVSFIKLAKQLSGFHIKQLTGRKLWTDGYFDRIVRHDDDLRRYVDYIVMNPVKAGLAPALGVHPHTWVEIEWTSKPDLQVGRDTNQQPAGAGILNPERSSPD